MSNFKFEIVEKNQARHTQGVEHNRVYIYDDGVLQCWLWMSDDDILKNKEKYGDDSFDAGGDELNDNMCELDEFICRDSYHTPCTYRSIENNELRCKYDDFGLCISAVAKTNAMVMELKKLGFKYVRLEG